MLHTVCFILSGFIISFVIKHHLFSGVTKSKWNFIFWISTVDSFTVEIFTGFTVIFVIKTHLNKRNCSKNLHYLRFIAELIELTRINRTFKNWATEIETLNWKGSCQFSLVNNEFYDETISENKRVHIGGIHM